jgi:hypothetical protein
MASESGIDEKDLRLSMLQRLEPKIYYKEGWIIMVNFLKHRVSDSPKYLMGIQKQFAELPKHIQEMAISYGYPIHTVCIPIPIRQDKIKEYKIKNTGSNEPKNANASPKIHSEGASIGALLERTRGELKERGVI